VPTIPDNSNASSDPFDPRKSITTGDNRMAVFTLPSIPAEMEWTIPPLDWKAEAPNRLTILAGERTNWFTDPTENTLEDTAPAALFIPPDPNFLLSAKVAVSFASTYDAGVIQIRERGDRWGKFCFEYSPQGKPTIVSVVTRGVSDDCNSTSIDGHEIFLRIAVTPQTISFHYSRDGAYWNLVRYFSLGKMDNLRVGFSSQSPTGKQCTAVFSEIRYRADALNDNRNGE
jgi:regulation of enolase protein 1 (concanavalin A-like superfamily)